MFPVLFEISGYQIHAYGFFIALGYLCSLLLLFLLARFRKIPGGPLLDLAFIAIVSGVIGARILFVWINRDYYRQFPGEIPFVWKGGLVFYGGLLFAIPCCAAYIRLRGLKFWETLDVLAPAVAIGHAFGRIGCLGAGCCHGSACEMPWAVRLNTDLVDPILRNVPVHPVQLYESFALFSLAALLIWMLGKELKAGVAACSYFVLYAILRIFVECFRGDQIRGFVAGQWLSTSQLISVGFLLAGLLLLRRRLRSDH